MNAVEIEEAVSALAAQRFDPDEFPFTFLEAFGNKATTIKRLRSGSSNKSDQDGESIYIGRRLRNYTERLEHLFKLYTKMTTKVSA